MLTTKPQAQLEKKKMSEENYRQFVIKLKSKAKKEWKQGVLKTHGSIKEFERTLKTINFEVLKQNFKSTI